MAVYVLIAGLVGAKVLLVVVEWSYYARNPRELLSIFQSGGVFYGGLLGGVPGGLVVRAAPRAAGLARPPTCWRPAVVHRPGHRPPRLLRRRLLLRQPADVPWAVTFRDVYASRTVGHADGHAAAPHPDLRVAGLPSLIFFFLLWLAPRKRFDGQVVLAYVVLYSVVRFVHRVLPRRRRARHRLRRARSRPRSSSRIVLVLAAAVVFPYLAEAEPRRARRRLTRGRLRPPGGRAMASRDR